MILNFIEKRESQLLDASLGILDLAGKLSSPEEDIVGLLIGGEVTPLLPKLEDSSLDKILVFEDQKLEKYAPDAFARIMVKVIKDRSPSIVMAASTALGKDLLCRVASTLDIGLANDCVAVESKSGKLDISKSLFGGNLLAKVELKTDPYLLTLKPQEFPPEPAENGGGEMEVEELDIPLPEDLVRLRVKKLVKPVEEGVRLTEAEKVVAGGRGVGSKEDFKLLQRLANILEGAVGGSRVAVDNGWLSADNQVGQTGKTIAPELYLACGISGAMQHMVGCKDSRIIVAVNEDPEAPIFSRADYGIVGDLFDVVPELIKKLEG